MYSANEIASGGEKTLRFILGKEVASFKQGSKRYKPGDVIVLPDNFPAHLYPFLKPSAQRAAPAAVRTAPPVSTAPAPLARSTPATPTKKGVPSWLPKK
jgi:hypothetical protein